MTKIILPFIFLLLIFSGILTAKESYFPTKTDIDRIVKPAIEGKWAKGIVIGLYQKGWKKVLGYGKFKDSKNPGSIILEIGSNTKPFTGTLLAEAVIQGKCKLDDEVSNHTDLNIPDFQGKKIKLWHLATHTSALPNIPSNFSISNPAESYKNYNLKDVKKAFASLKLTYAPGSKWAYSNIGMALCGQIVSKKAFSCDFEKALHEKILLPLGMTDTSITLSKNMKKRFVSGHDIDLNPGKNWDFGFLSPCGGIHSTVNDLFKWVDAQIHPEKYSIEKAILLSQKVHYKGKNMTVGLGWLLHAEPGDDKLLNHAGQTGAYTSWISICPEREYAVIVLSDTASCVSIQLGSSLNLAMSGKGIKSTLPIPMKLSKKIIDSVTG
ncbi:beta-lactamase family protein, partial [bacterium]|nr:beta-lactamase family protein [bacterium]